MFLGKVALSGECIKGYHNNGKYYLTSNTEEVEYYKIKSKDLIDRAHPLMDIYNLEHKNLFNSFILTDNKMNGTRRRILSTLPIHTISEDLLLSILKRNNISNKDTDEILKFVNHQKKLINTILKSNLVIDEISEISKEDFLKEPYSLLLAECFYQNKILYTYDEYLEHLKLTKEYEKDHSNYSLKTDSINPFKNIQISIHEGKWVMISKNINPTIHFVIKHSKLCNAIENFIAPIVE